MASIISQDGRNYKTVIAVNFVWEAQELAELLRAKGIKVGIVVNQQAARALDSEEIPALDSIERYKLPESNDKSLQVLISPYVLGEGFDAPATEVLVWASPTDSDLRYTQYTGRLARRWVGKRFGVIVDCLYQTSQYNWSYNMGMWMKDKVRILDSGLLYLGPETDIENLKRLPQVEGFQKQSSKKSLEELQTEGLLELQENDFPLTAISFYSSFIGDYKTIKPIVDKVVERLRKESPNMFIKRFNKTRMVEVVLDRGKFIKAMLEQGASLKSQEIEETQPTDFVISASSLTSAFIGGDVKLKPIAKKVMEKLKKENPSIFAKRRSANNFVEACIDRNRFVKEMVALGAILRDTDLEEVQETDFSIVGDHLVSAFVGSDRKLMKLAEEVSKDLEKENPDFIKKRRSGSHVIVVSTDQKRFIQEMLKRGAKLRPPK